jgi:hypothetical protein
MFRAGQVANLLATCSGSFTPGCYEIYRSGTDVDTRCAAVELLRVVGDRRALSWVQEFLDDSELGIQHWGAGVLDQLLWSGLVEPDECVKLLESMGAHPNARVRAIAEWIHSFLRKRETGAEPGAVADRPRD